MLTRIPQRLPLSCETNFLPSDKDHHSVGNRIKVRGLLPRRPKKMLCIKMCSFCLPLILGWYPLIKRDVSWKIVVSLYIPSHLGDKFRIRQVLLWTNSNKVSQWVYFTASRILGLAGQGSIYNRPESDISVALYSYIDSSPQSPDPSSDAPSSSSLPVERCSYNTIASCLSIAGPSTCRLHGANQEGLDQLKEMFAEKAAAFCRMP